MPWRGMSSMDLRRRFVDEYFSQASSMTELCAEYGVSRKTGYKWLWRFEVGGPVALMDATRRPHRSPTAVSPAIVEALLAARARKPHWGARKLRRWLHVREPHVPWPSRSTIHAVLHGHGLIPTRRRRRASVALWRRGLRRADHPNAVWTVDFKGHFRLQTGQRCHPLTLRDLASRYVLRCDAFDSERTDLTRRSLERAFATYGLPECIRSDNGQPFAGSGLGRLSRLNVWWLRLGIAVEQIALGRPDQNGAHEQFHRVLKAQTVRPPAPCLKAQQRRFDRFRHEYNFERPHEALGDGVPADHYHASARPWPRTLPPLEYPAHWEVRRVSAVGTISWANRAVFVAEALAGELVAFEEVDDAVWTLHFGTVPLARWLERERRFHSLRTD